MLDFLKGNKSTVGGAPATNGDEELGHSGSANTASDQPIVEGDTSLNRMGRKRPITPPLGRSLWNCCKVSYLNILLVFVPIGLGYGFGVKEPTNQQNILIFIFNFIAIIPLAKLLGYATEELALHVGETLGGLLNATFGNAVELIIAIIALTQGQIRIVQSSMLGSILSNLLLVLGMCFAWGGYRYHEQSFNVTAAQTSASLLVLACVSLIIPAAFHSSVLQALNSVDNGIVANSDGSFMQTQRANLTDSYGFGSSSTSGILKLSHGTALIMLGIYVAYLFFQLKTHKDLYIDSNAEEDEDAVEEGEMSLTAAIIVLIVVTVFVALCAEKLVDAIDPLTASGGISKTFVGLILLPIVGNAAEHVTSVTVAGKNKMDLAIGVAVGSSMQIALFVTPLLVILGWIINQPMTLYFETFETIILFLGIIMTNNVLGDGKSNYLEGIMLMATYIIIAIAFFFYPDTLGSGTG